MIQKVKNEIIDIMKADRKKGLSTYPEDFMQLSTASRQLLPAAFQELKNENKIMTISMGNIHSYELK